MPKKPIQFTARRKKTACEVFSATGSQVEAADAAKISRSTLLRHKHIDPVFAQMWADASERFISNLERAAHLRAVEGIEEEKRSPTGALISRTRKYSDGLLTMLLKAHRPDKYGQTLKVENKTTVDVKHRIDLGSLSPDQKQALRLLLSDTSSATPEITVEIDEPNSEPGPAD